jgi:N-acetyl-gamma-glutamyl-phosphate reductase
VALAGSLGAQAPRIIDASTAHRVADGWVYGFAELDANQAQAIKSATHVANPGCYPTGGIALLRPLVDAGLLPAGAGVTVNAVSGYSGGGKPMIESYEATKTAPAFELYGLGLAHKHVPELQRYSGLSRRPIFVPSVGNFRQGMLVSVPLLLDLLAIVAGHSGRARTSLRRRGSGAGGDGCGNRKARRTARCARPQRHRQARALRFPA